ncbi:MAG: glycosyltransferase, partial [Desulfobulbaceae bacterium]|nr:glycosyltransferase [Desulfobulbaceae bacterium]
PLEIPLVSVVIPCFNYGHLVQEAIESVLSQTFTNFELIIINDGSKDDSAEIIEAFRDPRIRFYNQENQGLAATLNRAIGLAKGEFVARQDQDDVSLPLRFEKQVVFLQTHPDHGMVGTWAEIWEGSQKTPRVHRHPTESAVLKFELLFNNPFVHSSMMIRKSVFNKVGLYSTDTNRQPPEDYELWSRVAREFEVANIPEQLVLYREMAGSMSRVGENPFLERLINLNIENLTWVLGRPGPDIHIVDLAALAHFAVHRLSFAPDFKEIACLIYKAAQNIGVSSSASQTLPVKQVNDFLHTIRRRYLKYRYGRVLGSLMALLTRWKGHV